MCRVVCRLEQPTLDASAVRNGCDVEHLCGFECPECGLELCAPCVLHAADLLPAHRGQCPGCLGEMTAAYYLASEMRPLFERPS